jgi:hypothetical protein
MRRTSIFLTLAASSLAGVIACTGGGGALPGFTDGWEEDTGERSQREVPTNGTERPAASQESPTNGQDLAPGSGGGGGTTAFVCSGVYACSVTSKGQTVTVNIRLQNQNGQCTANGAVLAPDGTIKSTKDGGEDEGTWKSYGNTLTVTTEDGSFTCVRTSATGGGTSGSSSSGGSGGGSTLDASAPPRPATDAG